MRRPPWNERGNFWNEPRVNNTNRLTRAYYTVSGPPVFESLGPAAVRWVEAPGAPLITLTYDPINHRQITHYLSERAHENGARSCNEEERVPTPSPFTDAPSLLRVILYAHVTSPWQLSSTFFPSSTSSPRFLSFFSCFSLSFFFLSSLLFFISSRRDRDCVLSRYAKANFVRGAKGSTTRASRSRSMFGNLA